MLFRTRVLTMGKGDNKHGVIEGKKEPHSVGFELEAVE